MSHLLQMRGLKPIMHYIDYEDIVASFTDAWIETLAMLNAVYPTQVASFTDAWIETKKSDGKGYLHYVASFTDAWIETVLLE